MLLDAELLTAVAEGDADAFSRFYDRHSGALFGLCLRILRNAKDAEDVLQEVFLQTWREARKFDPGRASVRTWLFTMARSRALDRYRSRRSLAERFASDDGLADRPSGEDLEKSAVLTHYVSQALSRLNAHEQEVLNLAYFEGLTQEEIAARLREPLGTVKSRARTGLRKLHASLVPAEAEVPRA